MLPHAPFPLGPYPHSRLLHGQGAGHIGQLVGSNTRSFLAPNLLTLEDLGLRRLTTQG